MPDSCDTAVCFMEPKIDSIDKDLAVVEERLTNSKELLSDMCKELKESHDAVIQYNVEIKHTQNEIKEIRNCVSSLKKDVSDLKISAARAGGKWGAITALITALVSAGGLTAILKFVF